jgi:hypothetical protein
VYLILVDHVANVHNKITEDKLIVEGAFKDFLANYQIHFFLLILFPLHVIALHLSILLQLRKRILSPSRHPINAPLQTLFGMLRSLILLIPETTNPGNYSPVPAHNQLIQQGQVHTVN